MSNAQKLSQAVAGGADPVKTDATQNWTAQQTFTQSCWNNSTGTGTNSYGFAVSSALTGATNNYGFHSNIASGTGRWNFYAAGTAANYFGGLVDISGASAGQIKFPATQNASADANTLDDYEEGTWTPVLSDGTNNATSSTASGTYTKIGRLVHAKCRITISSLGSVTGAIYITGLPFASNATAHTHSSGNVGFGYNFALTAGGSPTCIVQNNESRITMYTWDSTSGAAQMQATKWTASGQAMIDCTYYI